MINFGYSILNNSTGSVKKKTVVILGLPRGGTTMTATIVERLGVNLGGGLKFNKEDSDFAALLKHTEPDQAALKKLIENRNMKNDVWGFKFPYRLHVNLLQSFRNPYYIVVFRDVLAVGVRNQLSGQSDLLASMKYGVGSLMRLLNFIETSNRPTFLLSYEKCLHDAPTIVCALAEYLDVGASHSQVKNAISAVEPSEAVYTSNAQTMALNKTHTSLMGQIERVDRSELVGWAFDRKAKNSPVTVSLLVKGRRRSTAIADIDRSDLGHRFGNNCKIGFRFSFDGHECMEGSTQVLVQCASGEQLLLSHIEADIGHSQ